MYLDRIFGLSQRNHFTFWLKSVLTIRYDRRV